MIDPETGEAREEMRRVCRHIEAIDEALKQLGVQVNTYMDQPYDSGLPIRVIAFEPTAGVSREEIKETIKPEIKFRGDRIQMAEVIVGMPQTA